MSKILSGFLFLLSLLIIIPPPSNIFWKISILSMEWGHIFGILTLILFFLTIRKKGLVNKISLTLLLFSSGLFFVPLISAFSIQRENRHEFEKGFGEILSEPEINILQLFFFGIPKSKYKTYKYSIKNNLELDFYSSNIKEKSPCIIVIHGGGWDSGNRDQLQDLNFYLSRKKYSVAALSYRLAPKFRYPDPVDDIKQALEFIKKNAIEFNIDTSKFILLGRSAGGQIALQAAYTLHDKNIKGVIAFYTPSDMVWGYSLPGNPWILDSRKVLCNYIGGPCEQIPEKYKASSPVENVSVSSPPTLMIHGNKDVLVAYEHNLHLMKKLKAYKIKHALITLPWATHGFDFNLNGPGGQISTYYVEQFLKKTVN